VDKGNLLERELAEKDQQYIKTLLKKETTEAIAFGHYRKSLQM
jgi:hypothetical protein